MGKRVLIYPYSDRCISIISFLEKEKNIDELILVSFKGWGYENQKVRFRDKEIRICQEFESKCQECDEVWFVDTFFSLECEKNLLIEKARMAIENGKLIQDYREDEVVTNFIGKGESQNLKDIPKKLHVIHTPIILISGLYTNIEGFEIEAFISSELKTKYSIKQIGSARLGKILGMEEFPKFMLDTRYREKEKILLFNQYIKQIEEKEKPDMIVIGIPGGACAYSREVVCDFGMTFEEVANAVTVDIAIIALPYADYKNQDIERMRDYVWQRNKIYIDFFDLVPQKVNEEEASMSGKLYYLTLDDQIVMEKLKQLKNEDLYYLRSDVERRQMYENILKKLHSFGEIQFM